MSGDAGSSKSLFRTLEQFIFKEVLGVDVARKVLFEAFLFILVGTYFISALIPWVSRKIFFWKCLLDM